MWNISLSLSGAQESVFAIFQLLSIYNLAKLSGRLWSLGHRTIIIDSFYDQIKWGVAQSFFSESQGSL
jgi:hypothetical protein